MSKSESSSDEKKVVYLETSTLLPLLYITPYTNKTIKELNKLNKQPDIEFYIHFDCLKEIQGRFENNSTKKWRDDPVYRYDTINEKLDNKLKNIKINKDLNSAIRILLDGDIGDLENFNRFQVLFYLDLVLDQSRDICDIARGIEKRREEYIKICVDAIKYEKLNINTDNIISGWGNHYLENNSNLNINVKIFSDIPDSYENTNVQLFIEDDNNQLEVQEMKLTEAIHNETFMFPWDKKHRLKLYKKKNWTNRYIVNRDSYHFQCTMNHVLNNRFKDWSIIIADGGFKNHLKNKGIFNGVEDKITDDLINEHIILTNKNFNTSLRK